MKKLAWMFAALSLCACSLSACGGDDDNNNDKKANGEECSVAADCESNYCGDDKKCANKPADPPVTDDKAQKDESCAEKECADGLKCDDTSKVCVEDAVADDKAQKDESCAEKECADGLKCDDTSKVCVEDAAADDKAQKDESCAEKECADGLKCDDTSKVCVEDSTSGDDKAQKGDDCTDKECADGLKCDDTSKKCVEDSTSGDDKKDVGEACEKNEDCASNTCSEKVCISAEEDCTNFVASCETTTAGMIAYVACTAEKGIESVKCYENTDGKTDCKNGACVAPTSEEIECNETIACADSTKVCVQNKCVENTSTDECDDSGNKNCTGDKLCVAGKCEDAPKVGDACDESTFVAVCGDVRSLYICENKKVKKNSCATGMSCWTRQDKAGECAEACTGTLKEGDVQYADCDDNTNAAYNYICAKDYYGNAVMAFENVEACGSKKCSANENKESGEKAVCK